MKVIAALDNSLAARSSRRDGEGPRRSPWFGGRGAPHRRGRSNVAKSAADWAGLELRTLTGPTVERLVEKGSEDDVAALVVGARGTMPHPVGTTALVLAGEASQASVVVPPDVERPDVLRRIVAPLEGSLSASLTPTEILELAEDALSSMSSPFTSSTRLRCPLSTISPSTRHGSGPVSSLPGTVRSEWKTSGWNPRRPPRERSSVRRRRSGPT